MECIMQGQGYGNRITAEEYMIGTFFEIISKKTWKAALYSLCIVVLNAEYYDIRQAAVDAACLKCYNLARMSIQDCRSGAPLVFYNFAGRSRFYCHCTNHI